MKIFVGPGRFVASSPRRTSAHPGGIKDDDDDVLTFFFAAPAEAEVNRRFRKELIVAKTATIEEKTESR